MRPERPSEVDGCLVELTDSVWKMIERCWDSEATVRPEMTNVHSLFYRLALADAHQIKHHTS
jgi:hypothetical protein